MKLTQLHPDFGVSIEGVGLKDAASDDATYEAVRALFDTHSVLVFRDQDVDPDVQVAFSRAFGPLEITKVCTQGEGTFFTKLSNVDADGQVVQPSHRESLVNKANQHWHTDSSFKKVPALASVLFAPVIPEVGGETEFVSTRVAWQRLSRTLRDELDKLTVIHDFAHSRGLVDAGLLAQAERDAFPPVRWRFSWRNPVNGLESLYIGSHARCIEGLSQGDSNQLLQSLMQEATLPQLVYTHTWKPGDVIMWDNRATMHRGRAAVPGGRRTIVRTTVSARNADGLDSLRTDRLVETALHV